MAFPTPDQKEKIEDSDEKALYYRAPYSSRPNVKSYLPARADYPETPAGSAIQTSQIMDITNLLQADGSIEWEVPAGNWTPKTGRIKELLLS